HTNFYYLLFFIIFHFSTHLLYYFSSSTFSIHISINTHILFTPFFTHTITQYPSFLSHTKPLHFYPKTLLHSSLPHYISFHTFPISPIIILLHIPHMKHFNTPLLLHINIYIS
ncbi:hypothetical protein VIGAN_03135100, partial [Vigna angularis var. angularis]